MKIRMIPGPRNEEMIDHVRKLFTLDQDSEEWEAIWDEVTDYKKTPEALDMMDALYYASEYGEDGLLDQEYYLNWLMAYEEFDYFLDRMFGEINFELVEKLKAAAK